MGVLRNMLCQVCSVTALFDESIVSSRSLRLAPGNGNGGSEIEMRARRWYEKFGHSKI